MPRLTDEIIGALVPDESPPSELPVGVSDEDLSSLARSSEPREKMIILWTTFFQTTMESNWPGDEFPGFNYLTYGFVPVNDEGREFFRAEHPYVFGAAVELDATEDSELQTFYHAVRRDVDIPVVVNSRRIEIHQETVTGARGAGTVTCWANSNKSRVVPSGGILTANHVVEAERINQAVTSSIPGNWRLADRGGCKIDVALIAGSGGIPNNCTPLHIDRLPKQGSKVQFTGAATNQVISATISHSFVHPSLLTTRHPMRVFLDSYGLRGDSGALVESSATSLGAGIYMGRNPLKGTNDFEGVAQALCQGADQLKLDLYRT